MFVIVEWNRASGQPRVAYDTVYFDVDDAKSDAAELVQRTKTRHTVHQLNDELDEEG